MGSTSSKVKRKYNNKTYDRIEFNVPKGKKEEIKKYAESIGLSVNELIRQALESHTPREIWEEQENREEK